MTVTFAEAGRAQPVGGEDGWWLFKRTLHRIRVHVDGREWRAPIGWSN